MALVLRSIYDFYHFLFNECKDPRVEHYPFLGYPWVVLGIVIFYIGFVTKWGPEFMKNRKPYDLTMVLNIFNAFQVVINLYIGIAGLRYSYFQSDFSWTCEPISHTISPVRSKGVFITYLYYLVKMSDLLDTVFFVLRKKFNQVSFLHVYHHTGMALASYLFIKFAAGSHGTLLGVLNAWVHVVMYSYYFLTSFKPELKQSIWWKKHITQIQLVQFLILIIHFSIPLIFVECSYPMAINIIGVTQNLFMFILFSDFYYKMYIKKKTKTIDDTCDTEKKNT